MRKTLLPAPAAAALCCAAAVAICAAAAPPAPCTLVVGQGRFPATDDSDNAAWDRINTTLATQVAGDLAATGERTLLLTLPVAFDDVARVVAAVLDNARRERCDRVVETSLFVAADDDLIVARLRAYPVLREASRIGDPLHVTQREYPNTRRNLDRLQPAALGRDLSADYLRDPAAARPQSAAKQ